MTNNRCDFCREAVDPPNAHQCVDQYAVELAVLHDQVMEFYNSNEAYQKDQTPEKFARVCKAVEDLPLSIGPAKARFFKERTDLAMRVADAAAFAMLDGDDTLLFEMSLQWIEFRYKWDRKPDVSDQTAGIIGEAHKFLKQHKLTGRIERRPRNDLLQIITMLRDRLNAMSQLAHDCIQWELYDAEQERRKEETNAELP